MLKLAHVRQLTSISSLPVAGQGDGGSVLKLGGWP
jgi:hypothetical protein